MVGIEVNNEDVESALSFAGNNRCELERVLNYYEGEPDKLLAARFLIAGMRDKYAIDSNAQKVFDAKVITSDYLIRNIEEAFNVYKKRPWNKNLALSEFCELLLPYRIHNEPLTDWRIVYQQAFAHLQDTIDSAVDAIDVANILNDELLKQPWRLKYTSSGGPITPDSLLIWRVGDCEAECDFHLFLFRSIGIPSTTDRYKTGNVHKWTVIRDTTGRYELFIEGYFGKKGAIRGGLDGRTKGKIIRESWDSRNEMDVTADYYGENHFYSKSPAIGIFTRFGITPLAFGKRCLFSYRYENLEPAKVYFPIKKQGGVWKNAGYPFIYSSDGMRTIDLKPNLEETTTITVWRKVRMYGRLQERINSNYGCIVEGSIYPDFRIADTLGRLGRASINYNYLSIGSGRPYRFYRFSLNSGKDLRFGEICFFRDSERKDTIRLSIKATSKTFGGAPANLIDGDELTYFESRDEHPYVVFESETADSPALLEWVPINDDNFIRYDDKYELFYHAGCEGWQSVGCKVAIDTMLHFEKVPTGALFLLKDLTRGVEEEVFVMSEGKQLFL